MRALLLVLLGALSAIAADPPGGALDGQRPRVLISSDIGGGDPDDHQSMVHLLLYLLRGDPDAPSSAHWGGAFIKTDHGPNHWHDNPDPTLNTNNRPGANTVNTWRKAYLSDWQQRQDRTLPPSE